LTNPKKAKGDRAELEAAALLSDLTGFSVKRALGAGRAEDTGDLFGIPDTVIQVADWSNALAAVRHKPIGAESQRENANATFAASMIRLRGGVWRVVMTPEQFAIMWREATAPPRKLER
jgi:hypothetical protein